MSERSSNGLSLMSCLYRMGSALLSGVVAVN
jgi:hypothetical protein